jgi:hypothetical protein
LLGLQVIYRAGSGTDHLVTVYDFDERDIGSYEGIYDDYDQLRLFSIIDAST